nr:MAG TPA: hypothetical protein [Caudoviricetes sp.]
MHLVCSDILYIKNHKNIYKKLRQCNNCLFKILYL